MEELKSILNEIARDYGLKILEDPQKFKAVFADYAKGEYNAEKELFTKIIETGATKEIKDTEDISTTKKTLMKKLYDKYFLDEKVLDNYLDIFIHFLRNDYTIEIQIGKEAVNEIEVIKPTAKKTEVEEPSDEMRKDLFCKRCGMVFLNNFIQFCSNCGYPRNREVTLSDNYIINSELPIINITNPIGNKINYEKQINIGIKIFCIIFSIFCFGTFIITTIFGILALLEESGDYLTFFIVAIYTLIIGIVFCTAIKSRAIKKPFPTKKEGFNNLILIFGFIIFLIIGLIYFIISYN